jgi:DcuC family C4-dicarboxylate transporter
VGPALTLDVDPLQVGAVVSIASAAGRTMSLVAAVMLMCASLTDTSPFDLMKRIALPLLVGLVVVVGVALLI